MLVLAIDVCTERGVVALVQDHQIVYVSDLPSGLHNSRFLVPKVAEAFKRVGKSSKDLDLIAVGTGPGSYTGMRVGAAVAKSLSFASGVPLTGVCSLKGYIPSGTLDFAAVIDAKMAGCYLIKGERRGNRVFYQSEPGVWPLEEAGVRLEDRDVIVSPFCANLQDRFASLYPDHRWKWQELSTDVLHFCSLAIDQYEKNEYSVDGSLDLLYLK